MKLIKCAYCGAQYKPQKWQYGNYYGTTSIFFVSGIISEKQCPICWKEQPINKINETPTFKANLTMRVGS